MPYILTLLGNDLIVKVLVTGLLRLLVYEDFFQRRSGEEVIVVILPRPVNRLRFGKTLSLSCHEVLGVKVMQSFWKATSCILRRFFKDLKLNIFWSNRCQKTDTGRQAAR